MITRDRALTRLGRPEIVFGTENKFRVVYPILRLHLIDGDVLNNPRFFDTLFYNTNFVKTRFSNPTPNPTPKPNPFPRFVLKPKVLKSLS